MEKAKPITVQTIAGLIGRPGEGLPEVVNRVRNWTKEGLLETLGERNPGTGRRRHYPESAIAHALILSALTDIGIQAARSRIFGTAFDLAKHAASEVEQKEKDGQVIYLVISRMLGAAPQPGAGDTFVMLHYAQPIAIDEASIERDGVRLPVKIDLRDRVQLPPSAEIALVINLTNLFKRLHHKEG